MPGCRQILTGPTDELFRAGVCLGAINAMFAIVSVLPDVACPPPGVSREQMIRVVVAYIDARPERTHEDFVALGGEAIKAAWPCRR
jgi:hypothetical protein